MVERRWLRWVGPGMLAIAGVASVASMAAGATQRPWTPPTCDEEPDGRSAAARAAIPETPGDLAGEAWLRLDPRLDRTGTLSGQRLAVGLDGERSSRIVDLAVESFAAGPFGRLVLVGEDDGAVSRLRAIDVAGGCAWFLGDTTDVIRRATIDPAGETVYEMRVDRETRADLGIWTRRLDGTGSAARVLEPIDDDERFGRTFSTEFTWDALGERLAVQSCGEVACRTRIVDTASAEAKAVAVPDLGSLVGLAGDRLVTYAACPGLPCPVISTDIISGARTVLAEAALTAVLATTTDGPRLVHEVATTSGLALRSTALDGASTELGALGDGLRLHATPATAGSATRVSSGWVFLSPDGRLPETGPGSRTQLRHVIDGTTVQLQDVAR